MPLWISTTALLVFAAAAGEKALSDDTIMRYIGRPCEVVPNCMTFTSGERCSILRMMPTVSS